MGVEQVIAGRYRLLGELGRGGMGVVWRAEDTVLGRQVAVKEVLTPSDQAARRAIREARSAARMSHPSVVKVFDVVEEAGRPWVVMEYVEARSLQQVIKQDGPLPPERVARIGRQILGALGAAHRVGILHRDVKPGNVLLAAGDRAVLTDFGIALMEGDATLTQAGGVLGSPAYIAPERIRGERALPPSDLWALGVTLYAALTGRSPFHRADPVAVFGAVLNAEPRIPPEAQALRPVLEGLLHKDPAARMTIGVAEAVLLAITEAPAGRVRLPEPPPVAPPQATGGGTGDAARPSAGDVTVTAAGVGAGADVERTQVQVAVPRRGPGEASWRLGGVFAYSGMALLLLGSLFVLLSSR
ncbi:serine/threonine-protein kinase [Spirillospora sp. NPDC047279]|uniref:serine/threonine-protein kinase n=1 Tax=Spirillospora sp. NPDC047279 TaxID=3155478 RepID=UPI0033C3A901